MELKSEARKDWISHVRKIKNPMSSRGECRAFSFPSRSRGTE
jgi:hypothetical protein